MPGSRVLHMKVQFHANHEIPDILQNLKAHCFIHNYLPLVSALSQLNPDDAIPFFVLRLILTLSSYLCVGFLSDNFPTKTLYIVCSYRSEKKEIKGFYLWKNRQKRFNWKVVSKAAYEGIKNDQNRVTIRIQNRVYFVIRFKVSNFMLCGCKLGQVINFYCSF